MSATSAHDAVRTDDPPEQSESEALLQFVYMAPVGLVQIDAAGDILMMNPKAAQLLVPLSASAILVNLLAVLEPHTPGLRSRMNAFEPTSGRVCDALRVEVPTAPKKPSIVLQLTLDRLDRSRFMAVLTDISLQVQREKELRKSEAWVNAIITGVKDYALATLDATGCISNWNESIGRVTGLSEQAVKGQPFSVLFRPDAITADRRADLLVEADQNGWSLDEGWRVRERQAGPQQFWGSVLITPLESAEEAPPDEERSYGLILRDLDDKREAASRLREASSADYLTGLLNRRAFVETAELEVARWRRTPRPLSLIMIDLDHFKSINDLHGHAAGDAVIRDVGSVIEAATRDVDAACRYGGEEFAVLLPSTELGGAAAFAERIGEAVRTRTVEHGALALRYTISVGVAAMGPATSGLDALLAKADEAMYAAKAAGRDRVKVASAK